MLFSYNTSMNVIKKISREAALKGAFVCWLFLGFCLYSGYLYQLKLDTIDLIANIFRDFDPLYMFKGGRALDPIDFVNYLNKKNGY